ncbi:uncharacterized protein LOC141641454 [Silene latifolia]|uniref:uncharacterized protein LOC141641454 n=1 Tax=Silene latifolia TaxID=37657 RepID=UPI003D7747B6
MNYKNNMYDIVFLSETKCSTKHVASIFQFYGFSHHVGVDAIGSKGGLWLGWKSSWNIDCITKNPNFIIIKVNECGGRFWYIFFIYGAPKREQRQPIWLHIEQWIARMDSHFVLLGDFNQVEFKEDKLGGNKGSIYGAEVFSEWKVRNSLYDIAFKGPKFTWCNNRKGTKRIYERIDKGLASPLWYSLFPYSGIKHFPIQCSDHAPIIFDTAFFEPHKRKTFRMEAWAFEYEDSLRLLKHEWFSFDRGSPVTKLSRKLQRTRHAFKNWTLTKRKSWNEKWSEFDDKLEVELERIFSGHTEEGFQKCHADYIEFNKAATLYWRQRAKLHWIKDGDAGIRFFFNSVKSRHDRNLIVGLKKDDNSWTFDKQELAGIFDDHFKQIYGVNSYHAPFPQYQLAHSHLFDNIKFLLTNDQQDFFSSIFTRKEVRTAVFQLGPTKSPGPDGIPALFYQKFWFHIKTEVEDAVLFMLNTGNISTSFNRTAIALIPKVASPETVDNFRPSSLCNVIMKIVTKCICNRLKKVMSHLVGDYQNGFVPGRYIADNILLSHELLHHISHKRVGKRGLLAVKVDMSKAYDRLDWNFIKCTLLSMKFPSKFVDLVMNCVTTVSYEVLINGSSGKSFRPKAGIRQGDPLSSYLFALCTEVLSQLLCAAQDKNQIKGIRVSREAPPISHLLFADDSIFFMDARASECEALMTLLSQYGDASGQRINEAKTTITTSPNCTLRSYRDCLKILKAPGHKVLVGRFYYAENLHWCSNLVINASKSDGGLGIRNIGCLNQSLLAKIGWKILTAPTSLISKVLGPKFKISPDTIFSSNFVTAGNRSWGERGICWGIQLLRRSLAWQVGFPSLLDVWKDKWIYGLSLGQLLGLSDPEIAAKPPLTVCQLQTAEGIWDVDAVSSICGNILAPYILALPLAAEDFDDNLYWSLSKTGQYSVKSGYAMAFSVLWSNKATDADFKRMDTSVKTFCKKRLWNLPIQGKWKTFLWKLLSNSLPIGIEASKRSLPWNYYCKLCASFDTQLESLDHLFRDCLISSHIWAGSPLGIRSSNGKNIYIQSWVINWISFLYKDDSFDSCILFISTLWRIWCLRNDTVFRSDSVMGLSSHIKILTTDAINQSYVAQLRLPSSSVSIAGDFSVMESIKNHLPVFIINDCLCSNNIRLLCDASWHTDFTASAGWIFKDLNGVILHTGQSRFWASSTLQAEGTALLHALRDAARRGFWHISAHSDCLPLVLILAACTEVQQDLKALCHSIFRVLVSFIVVL